MTRQRSAIRSSSAAWRLAGLCSQIDTGIIRAIGSSPANTPRSGAARAAICARATVVHVYPRTRIQHIYAAGRIRVTARSRSWDRGDARHAVGTRGNRTTLATCCANTVKRRTASITAGDPPFTATHVDNGRIARARRIGVHGICRAATARAPHFHGERAVRWHGECVRTRRRVRLRAGERDARQKKREHEHDLTHTIWMPGVPLPASSNHRSLFAAHSPH